MSLLKKVLVILAVTCAPLNPAAATAGPDKPAGSPPAAHHDSGFTSAVPDSYSFADIVNLPAGAEQRRLSGGAFDRFSEADATDLSGIGHSTRVLPVASNLNGAFDDLSDYPSSARTAGFNSHAGILFATDGIPEPSGWMLLICGLAVAAFMVRRKRAPLAD